tara:strand:+ start:1521 stop:1976 length:456 start_codon:yes stop_codon:yes gene_type:complete
MKVVLQRVKTASVKVDNNEISKIDNGLLLLWGIEKGDVETDIENLTRKIINLRIFSDEQGKMNKSIVDIGGEILLVSQFTLNANIQKGNRPSFINSEEPDIAEKMIEKVAIELSNSLTVKQGIFGAFMEVSLINDGPLTMFIESKDGRLVT